jgi:hypothetical protein
MNSQSLWQRHLVANGRARIAGEGGPGQLNFTKP